MAVGLAYARWMTAALAAGAIVVSEDTASRRLAVFDPNDRPWEARSAHWDLNSMVATRAKLIAERTLIVQQAARRVAEEGAPAGLISWSSMNLKMEDTGNFSCVSTGNKIEVCEVIFKDYFPVAQVANEINRVFGRSVAGLWDGSKLKTPSGEEISVSVAIVADEGTLLVTGGGK